MQVVVEGSRLNAADLGLDPPMIQRGRASIFSHEAKQLGSFFPFTNEIMLLCLYSGYLSDTLLMLDIYTNKDWLMC